MATPHGGATYGNTSLSGHARAHLGNVATNGVTGNVGYDGATANHQARLHQGQYVNHGSNHSFTGNNYNYFIQGYPYLGNSNVYMANSNASLPLRPNNTPKSPSKTSPHPKFQYGTLALGHVRLFALHCSGTEPEILEISMYYLPAEDLNKYKYMALSFSWSAAGNGQVPLHVRIPASASQPEITFQALQVPINLDMALRWVRSTSMSNQAFTGSQSVVYLWANSICMNWDSPIDLRQLNAFIPDVFRLADWHIAWLGPKSDQSDMAIKFAAEAVTASSFEQLIASDSGLEKCKAFVDFLKNPLFSHRAFLAELALSYRTMLVIGDKRLDWQPFTVAVEHFSQNFNTVQLEARYSRNCSEEDFTGDIEGLPVMTLVRNIANVSRRSGPKGSWEPLMTLEQLLSVCASCIRFRGSPEQGLLRCLIPVAKRESRIAIPENLPIDDILSRIAASIIRRTRSLDVLCQPWALDGSTTNWTTYSTLAPPKRQPSWIRRCDRLAYPTTDPAKLMQRMHGDPFVSLANSHSTYNACNGRRARYRFAEWYEEQEKQFATLESLDSPANFTNTSAPSFRSLLLSKSITVDGLFIGTVTSVSEPMAEGVIPSHILSILGWDPQNPTVMPDKLLRSLVADRGPDGRSIPAAYATACKLIFDQLSVNGHLNTTRLLDHSSNDNTRAFLKRVQAVVWNRRFLEVSVIDKRPNLPGSGGKLHGWGPPDAYRGQELIFCILFGCSVPCILRKLPGNEYQFVGETYVYELMDGEAVSSLGEEEIEGKRMEWRIV